MAVTQLLDLKPGADTSQIPRQLTGHLASILGYNNIQS
jgi:hypothetical protein